MGLGAGIAITAESEPTQKPLRWVEWVPPVCAFLIGLFYALTADIACLAWWTLNVFFPAMFCGAKADFARWSLATGVPIGPPGYALIAGLSFMASAMFIGRRRIAGCVAGALAIFADAAFWLRDFLTHQWALDDSVEAAIVLLLAAASIAALGAGSRRRGGLQWHPNRPLVSDRARRDRVWLSFFLACALSVFALRIGTLPCARRFSETAVRAATIVECGLGALFGAVALFFAIRAVLRDSDWSSDWEITFLALAVLGGVMVTALSAYGGWFLATV